MGKRHGLQYAAKGLAFSLVVVVSALCLVLCQPASAHADELSAVREKIDQKVEELEKLGQEVVEVKERIDKLDAQMEQTLKEIDQKQAEYAKLQSSSADLAVELYKDRESFNPLSILENSDSFQELMVHLDMNERVLTAYVHSVHEAGRMRDVLTEKYRQVSFDKDEQQKLEKSLQKKTKKLEKSVAELREQEEKILSADQQAKLAQAAAAAKEVAQTFETGTAGSDTIEWKTGLATAYGGSSDKSTPKDAKTATGTVCDDWSVGVAVPMAWGPSEYYGKRVELSYEGRSIIAPVVDCGYMGNGYVSFDFQPGVFKAFGCSDCDDWGVREVRYRFLD